MVCEEFFDAGNGVCGCGCTESEHYPDVEPRNCYICGVSIPLGRLAILPKTIYCVKCSNKHSPTIVHDPEVLCAKSSPSCQNGFAPND